MTPDDRQFLSEFFRAVTEAPLGPEDPRYVPLYESDDLVEDDPVELLAKAIDYLPESVQLLAGFRGIGKSTELRRLRARLQKTGYKVVLVDVEDYVNQSSPVDVSDFLMALAGAFGEKSEEDEDLLGKGVLKEGYWERAIAFSHTRIELSEFSGEVAAGVGGETSVPGFAKAEAKLNTKLGFKANLREDPTFKKRLQERMAGHLGALVADVRKFFEDCLKAFRKKYGDDVKVVVLVDSMEHIRGTSINAVEVQASIETLFASHAENLILPGLHAIYTIPPFLKVRYPNLGSKYAGGAVQMFPAIKIKDKEDGVASQTGTELLRKVVEQRHPQALRLLAPEQLTLVIQQSGGHLRDLLRLIREIIRRTKTLPANKDVVMSALNQIRSESLPIAEKDAIWLARIAKTHHASLEDRKDLADLARFFDTNLVLCYRDGPEWYDVHPFVREHVLELVKKLEARALAAKKDG